MQELELNIEAGLISTGSFRRHPCRKRHSAGYPGARGCRVSATRKSRTCRARPPPPSTLPYHKRHLFSYTKVYSVIYDSGSVPRRAIFSPRETLTRGERNRSCPPPSTLPYHNHKECPPVLQRGGHSLPALTTTSHTYHNACLPPHQRNHR